MKMLTPAQYAEFLRLKDQYEKRNAYLGAKEKSLNLRERQLMAMSRRRRGLGDDPQGNPQPDSDLPDGSNGYAASNMAYNFANNPNVNSNMVPGNVGSINRVIWPFYFTTDPITLDINTTITTGFTITQEAAFIWMSYTKVVYLFDSGTPLSTYIDPENSGTAGLAPNLSFTIRDSQSARDFENTPINLDGVGRPNFPTNFPRPMMILPNSNMEISFTNSDASNVYQPFLTAFGYRVRIEDAQNILSLVTA